MGGGGADFCLGTEDAAFSCGRSDWSVNSISYQNFSASIKDSIPATSEASLSNGPSETFLRINFDFGQVICGNVLIQGSVTQIHRKAIVAAGSTAARGQMYLFRVIFGYRLGQGVFP